MSFTLAFAAPALAYVGALVLPGGWPLRGLVLAVLALWLWTLVDGAAAFRGPLALVTGVLCLGRLMRLVRARAEKAGPRGRALAMGAVALTVAAAIGGLILAGG